MAKCENGDFHTYAPASRSCRIDCNIATPACPRLLTFWMQPCLHPQLLLLRKSITASVVAISSFSSQVSFARAPPYSGFEVSCFFLLLAIDRFFFVLGCPGRSTDDDAFVVSKHVQMLKHLSPIRLRFSLSPSTNGCVCTPRVCRDIRARDIVQFEFCQLIRTIP